MKNEPRLDSTNSHYEASRFPSRLRSEMQQVTWHYEIMVEYITQYRMSRHLQSMSHPHLKISSAKRASLQARKSVCGKHNTCSNDVRESIEKLEDESN
jgi:hypothetical protein